MHLYITKMSGGRVKTVALSQNDLICVSTANQPLYQPLRLVIFIVTYEIATLLVWAFYLVKSCEKAIFLMRPFGSVVLPKKV